MKRTRIKPISRKRQTVIKYEAVMREVVLQRANGLCERCGQAPDWRGLSIHHTKHKGMGGTIHLYLSDEMEAICGKCHSEEHGVQEK